MGILKIGEILAVVLSSQDSHYLYLIPAGDDVHSIKVFKMKDRAKYERISGAFKIDSQLIQLPSMTFKEYEQKEGIDDFIVDKSGKIKFLKK